MFSAINAFSDEIWTGDGGDNEWSNNANWQDNSFPASGAINGSLIFGNADVGDQRVYNINGTYTDIAGIEITGTNSYGLVGNGNFSMDSGASVLIEAFLTFISVGFTSNGAGFTFNGSAGCDFWGPISGESITIDVSKFIIFHQINTYTGTTTINNGTLIINSGDSIADTGLITLANSANATLQLDSNETIGALSGGGAAGGNVRLLANSTLTVGDASNRTYAGIISGAGGSLIKTGSGIFTLTGANTYSGSTVVNAGTLWVNGSIVGTTTVGAGGTLGGIGSVGDVTVNGRFAPGNSIGTINTGNLTFNAGSIYEVEVDAAGNSDRTNVTGTVSLGNAALNVLAENGTYAAATDYLIIDNDGVDPVTGTFGNLTSNLAFLDPSVSYAGGDGNDVILTMTRNYISFSQVAFTPNQRAVATALENITPVATGDMAGITTVVTGLSAPQARSAYDQMGGAGMAAFSEIDLSASTQYMKILSNRISFFQSPDSYSLAQWNSGPLLASSSPIETIDPNLLSGTGKTDPLTSEKNSGFWGQGIGVWGDRKGKDIAEQYDFQATGAVIGLDHRFNNNFLAGLSFSYSESDLAFDKLDDTGEAQKWETALYSAWMSENWNIDFMAAYARNDYDTKRHITFGSIDRIAEGSFDGNGYSAYLEGSYLFGLKKIVLQPMISFQLVRMNYDGYTETGAGALNLKVRDRDETSMIGSLGLRAVKAFQAADNKSLVLELRARWAHEFNKDNRLINTSFAGDTSYAGNFRVEGGDPVSDRLVTGAGLTFHYWKNMNGYLNYDASIGNDALDHCFSIGVRFVW